MRQAAPVTERRSLLARNTRRGVVFLLSTEPTRSVPVSPASSQAVGEQVIEVGRRERALQALVAAREGAVNAKRAGLCQLRDLLITAPEPLRSELRPLSRARLLQSLAATRPDGRHDPEPRGSLLALRNEFHPRSESQHRRPIPNQRSKEVVMAHMSTTTAAVGTQ